MKKRVEDLKLGKTDCDMHTGFINSALCHSVSESTAGANQPLSSQFKWSTLAITSFYNG